MNDLIREEFGKLLIATGNKVLANNCEMNEEQAIQMMALISHEPVSKEVASTELNMSRTKFNNLVDEGKLPKGRKRRGWKELVWYKDEIFAAIRKN